MFGNDNKVEIGDFTPELLDQFLSQDKDINQRLDTIEKKVNELTEIVKFMPGGVGFNEAQKHFTKNI